MLRSRKTIITLFTNRFRPLPTRGGADVSFEVATARALARCDLTLTSYGSLAAVAAGSSSATAPLSKVGSREFFACALAVPLSPLRSVSRTAPLRLRTLICLRIGLLFLAVEVASGAASLTPSSHFHRSGSPVH